MNSTRSNNSILQQLDSDLFDLVKDVDILDKVAPKNFHEAKKAFFASNASTNPDFVYSEQNIDVFQCKRTLYQLPVEMLPDPDLIQIYSEVIESFADKLDQFQSIGTPDFIYDSMRYYGEPSEKDIRNANFILHAPDNSEYDNEELVNTDRIVEYLNHFGRQHSYEFTTKIDPGMIANALVSGTTVKINAHAKILPVDLYALAHHELGVHLVTTLNARLQPLKILSLGSPVSTTTQEGLAILCEYLAGHLTLSRLKTLALRVIAVESLIKERDFKKTFSLLKEQHNVADELAFTITSRVYRGGGFTKDYLYLQGFHKLLNAYETQAGFKNLLAGKASMKQLPLITKLIDKGYLTPPALISPAIADPQPLDPIKQFLAHAIK